MTQPVAYVPATAFNAFAPAGFPNLGANLDTEYQALKTTTDQIRVNLAILQRDDTNLANGIVTPDSLSTATKALIGTTGWEPRGAWLTATSYAVKDVVTQSNIGYVCLTAHTSGVFATDLAAGKWAPFTTAYTTTAFGLSMLATADAASALVLLGLTITAFAKTILDDADAAAVRVTIGLNNAANVLANTGVISADNLAALSTDATGGATGDLWPFIDVSAANASKKVATTDLFKNVLANFTAKASPVLADTLMIADSEAAGAAKIVTLTAISALVLSQVVEGQKWPPGTLNGLNFSRTSTTTYTVNTGYCVNEDGGSRYDMTFGSSMVKSLSAWAAGTGVGSLDTGAVANNTWYHIHIIRKNSDGTLDVLLSTSATSPTMPSGYTARRRIGSIRTNGSAQIIAFSQNNDEFLWDATVLDIDVANPGTAAVTRTLTVPTGVKVNALLMAGIYNGSTGGTAAILSSLDMSDEAPMPMADVTLTGSHTIFGVNNAADGRWRLLPHVVRTNTSAQIRSRLSASGANDRLGIATRGWIDTRGK